MIPAAVLLGWAIQAAVVAMAFSLARRRSAHRPIARLAVVTLVADIVHAALNLGPLDAPRPYAGALRVPLVGASGVGRSHLLADLYASLAMRPERVFVLTAQCSPLEQETSYSLAASLIRRRFDIREDDDVRHRASFTYALPMVMPGCRSPTPRPEGEGRQRVAREPREAVRENEEHRRGAAPSCGSGRPPPPSAMAPP